MKAFICAIFLIILGSTNIHAQIISEQFQGYPGKRKLSSEELNAQLNKYDFSELLNSKDNSIVYGFIGTNYQRIRIKFIRISQDSSASNIYNVYGKSMVKKNVDEFYGTIKILSITRLKITEHGCEDEYKYKGFKGEFSIFGEYTFSENKDQAHSGIFKGKFQSDYFLDKNYKVRYDDIEDCADGFTNNQFEGTWTDYKTHLSKICNWGDYRIPNSGDFDIGAGEFSPNSKYSKYGWQNDDKIDKSVWWK